MCSFVKQPITSQFMLQFNKAAVKSEKVSILLVGHSEYCRVLCDSLYSVNKTTHRIQLTISQSESIEQMLDSSSPIHVDFIVFVMNTAKRHCIESVERNICLIEHVYLCDKTVLVNGSSHLKPVNRGLCSKELFNICQKYRLRMFNGNLEDEHSSNRLHLAKSVLNFVVLVCGVKSEMPIVLDFPTNIFPLDSTE